MSDPRLLNYHDYPKGIPAGAVRIMRPSRWGNPYFSGSQPGGRALAIAQYRTYLEIVTRENPRYLEPLRGKQLVCACEPLPCHGNVILEWLDTHPSDG